MTDQRPRVLLLGCGGIGGVIAANLISRNAEVVAVTHDTAIAEAINRRGFEVRYHDTIRRIHGRAFATLPSDPGVFDFIFLATRPSQVIDAACATAPLLREQGAMLCFQNGLCEQHVAPIVGANHTIGAVVTWGSSMPAPGVYERTSSGGFMLGRLDGADDVRFPVLRSLLGGIGPVEVTRNLAGARWSKLAINCAISAIGAIGAGRLGELFRYRFVRRLGLEAMTEAVTVARRHGVQLEKVSGTIDLEWTALTPADVSGPGSPSLFAKHALVLAVGSKFRHMRSSMLSAIERGRDPAVQYINGEVVRHAADLRIPVPINRRIQQVIDAIWRREYTPSLSLLRRFYDDTRAEVYAATATGFAPPPSDTTPRKRGMHSTY